MKIAGLEKFSGVDYDGKLACTVFLSGCNFRCPFCHNSPLVISNEENITEQEFFNFLNERKAMLNGVCVSGGEPTLYKELPQFIVKIKALGYCVKLDTNGTNPQMLAYLIDNKLIDYVAMDIKNSFLMYPITVGVDDASINAIKQSIKILLEDKVDYELRTTLIKQYHTVDDIITCATEIEGAKKLYLQKFKDSENCLQKGLTAVSKQDAELYKDIFSDYVKEVHLRGY